MVAIVMDTDGCDIGHEALLLKEYSEEAVMFAPGTGPSERSVARTSNRAIERERTLLSLIAPSPALAEVGDSVRILRSSAFPPCP